MASESPDKAAEPEPGISIAAYKKLADMVADEAALRSVFGASQLRRLQATINDALEPVSTGGRDDISKAERGDRVVAVRLRFRGRSATEARQTVGMVADLLRDALLTRKLQDTLEAGMQELPRLITKADTEKARRKFTNESLAKMAAQLERLALRPESSSLRLTGAREVVDVTGGGSYFLPPALQVVGARSKQADNEHTIRMLTRDVAAARLRIDFLTRLDERVREASKIAKSPVVRDLPELVAAEARLFLGTHQNPDVEAARYEIEAIGDRLKWYRMGVVFVREPTVQTESRLPLLALAAIAAVCFLVALVLVLDRWQRSHTGT